MLMTYLQAASDASATYHENVITVLSQALAGIVMMGDGMSLEFEGHAAAGKLAGLLSVGARLPNDACQPVVGDLGAGHIWGVHNDHHCLGAPGPCRLPHCL